MNANGLVYKVLLLQEVIAQNAQHTSDNILNKR